jgi:hypothetical protein
MSRVGCDNTGATGPASTIEGTLLRYTVAFQRILRSDMIAFPRERGTTWLPRQLRTHVTTNKDS